jgi:hypothetical protein
MLMGWDVQLIEVVTEGPFGGMAVRVAFPLEPGVKMISAIP